MPEVVTEPELVSLLQVRAGSRLFVAIDGYSGSGKSTLAWRLCALTGASLVQCDDFYRDLPDDVRRSLTPEQGVDQYFDWQRLRDEALVPLREGRAARFLCYNWEAGGGLDDWDDVPAAEVVILEGVYSARPEFAEYIDLAVYVDLPQPVRQARIAARGHGHDEWNARWDASEDVYFGRIRPPSSFEYTVDGQ